MPYPRFSSVKFISKPIFAILGCATSLATAQEGSPPGSVFPPGNPSLPPPTVSPENPSLPPPVISPEYNSLIDPVPSSEAPRARVVTDFDPVPDIPPMVEIPDMVKEEKTDRKWKVIPYANIEISSTDNLFISATKRRSDFFSMISPGLAVGWGDYGREVRQLGNYEPYFEPMNLRTENIPNTFVFGRYNVNASFFANNSDQNSVDHDALIAARWEGAKLTVAGRFYFQTLSDRDIEVGNRVDRTVYGGEIKSSYSFSDKTSLELNLYNHSYDYAKQLDWQEWIVEDWFSYLILPKTRVSIGTRLGLTKVESSPTQTFEQLVGRVAYFPAAKLGLSFDGGVEWRQFGGGGGDEVFGVFNFAATYAPRDGTLVALKGYRRNSASVVQSDDNITATGFSAVVQQRFLQRYYLALEGGFENSVYRSKRTGTGSSREDDTTYVKASLSFDVTKNLSAEAAYQHRRNDSSINDLSFDENVLTLLFRLRL